jgi:hypothetical protein
MQYYNSWLNMLKSNFIIIMIDILPTNLVW